MWYFTWVLGVLLACSFGIINAMWLEVNENLDRDDEQGVEPIPVALAAAAHQGNRESSRHG